MPQLSLVYDREILKRISFSTAYIVVAHGELVRSYSIIFSAANHFILTSLTRRCSQPLAALRFRRSKALPPTNINPHLGSSFGVAELDVRLYKMTATARHFIRPFIYLITTYILSFGPIFGFCIANGLNQNDNFAGILYRPLIFLSSIGGIWNPLLLYVMFFEVVIWRGH